MNNELLSLNSPLSGNKGVSWQQVEKAANDAEVVKAYTLTASGIDIDWIDGTKSSHREPMDAMLAIQDNNDV